MAGFADYVSEEAMEDVELLWRELKVSLQEGRPWMEFVEVFKPPIRTDLERRMSTNFLYYKTNYAQIVLALLGLSLLLSPRTVLSLVICGLVTVAIFLVKPTVVPEMKLTRRNRTFAAVLSSCLILLVSGALLWMLAFLLVGILIDLLHMILRPRNLHSKYNAAADDVKNFFFGEVRLDNKPT